MFGPWLHHFHFRANASDLVGILADAATTAASEIASSIPALPWIDDGRYPSAEDRVTVTGRVVVVSDSRPADKLWVMLTVQNGALSSQNVTAPTWFVRTDAGGAFVLPGIPPNTYSLYVWANGGAMVGVAEWPGIALVAPSRGGNATVALGELDYSPGEEWARCGR